MVPLCCESDPQQLRSTPLFMGRQHHERQPNEKLAVETESSLKKTFCPHRKYFAAVVVDIRAAYDILPVVMAIDWMQHAIIAYFLEDVFPALLLASCKTEWM